ncbi:MarR family transcriptional regulator [Clostridium botulinum A2 117]|uniref:MarR family transcriptional regulator n=1 Tax=Clostridium botulinum TaxID=1491 RepID=A0AA44BN21_CLOBO|nr:MarR family transcriptional regulator [Clostridium botulinum]KEI78023.1 MarR family transcriptional regulator [Clostridium botulinum A2 117]MBN3415201.1 MarR family transcriptional regulator [Clostridium botulinum]MBN3441494.1 MarR family transcriptional regulator [Clostridium botulinum]MBY6805559.1 MarR family transcriptional regulator [Clostridium botulinum]NFI07314.1 MarR family transcriptional regulator [Clostridium botulinum]
MFEVDNINSIMEGFKEIYEKEEILGKIAFRGEYEKYGVSEIHCIDFIGKIENPNVTKISENMNMTRGAISKICKKLLNNKLIDKYKKPENDKEIYFKLTKSGEELYKRHEIKHKKWEERNNNFFKNVDREEQEIVASFLKKFNNFLDKIIQSEGDV